MERLADGVKELVHRRLIIIAQWDILQDLVLPVVRAGSLRQLDAPDDDQRLL